MFCFSALECNSRCGDHATFHEGLGGCSLNEQSVYAYLIHASSPPAPPFSPLDRIDRVVFKQQQYTVQQIPDTHTMLNHTTLLFAPNLPGINRNINKFALIITQKSPDNHTMSSQFSTFTAFIYELLLARKYCLWFLRLQRQFASVSII